MSQNNSDRVMITPWNICMKPVSCAVCDTSKNIKTIKFGRLNAVFCCNDSKCCKVIKNDLLTYINQTKKIPLYGLLDSKNNDRLTFNFYRKSQYKVWKGDISAYVRNHFCISIIKDLNDNSLFSIKLEYTNNESKISNNTPCFSRNVALDNIMFHNKDFYNKLSNCNNLFNSDRIVVSFNELSDDIRDTIYMYNLKNLKKESSEFLF